MMNESSARRTLARAAGAEAVSVVASGRATSAHVAGRGPPLLLLHGLTAAGGLVWWPVIPALSDRHRVIAPDLPGLGESEGLDGGIRPEHVVMWLGHVVDTFCEEPPVLVATSLGSSFALRFVLARPDRAQRLVVVNGAGLAPFRPPPGFVLASFLNTARPSPRVLNRLASYVVHDQERVSRLHGRLWDAFLEHTVEQARRPTVNRSLRKYTNPANSRKVPASHLAQIPIPVELIWGEYDRPFPLSIAESVRVRYGWPLQVITDAGHLPYIEQPALFARALRIT